MYCVSFALIRDGDGVMCVIHAYNGYGYWLNAYKHWYLSEGI